jgi:hypothetical protein
MKVRSILLFTIFCLSCQSKEETVTTALISDSNDQELQNQLGHSNTFEPTSSQQIKALTLDKQENPQLDPYQRKSQAQQASIEERECKAIYIQLIKAITQKDHMKVKALKAVIVTQYPQTSYAQRLKREGEGTMAAIAGVTTFFLTLTKLGLDPQIKTQERP